MANVKCPKCGAGMVFIKNTRIWYCLNDGTEIPEAQAVDMVRADDPKIKDWRKYL